MMNHFTANNFSTYTTQLVYCNDKTSKMLVKTLFWPIFKIASKLSLCVCVRLHITFNIEFIDGFETEFLVDLN